MGAVAKWEEGIGASSINHIDQFPSVTIDFNLPEGVPLERGAQPADGAASQNLSIP